MLIIRNFQVCLTVRDVCSTTNHQIGLNSVIPRYINLRVEPRFLNNQIANIQELITKLFASICNAIAKIIEPISAIQKLIVDGLKSALSQLEKVIGSKLFSSIISFAIDKIAAVDQMITNFTNYLVKSGCSLTGGIGHLTNGILDRLIAM